MKERYRNLNALVQSRAEDAYRTGFVYDAEGWQPLYIRKELRTRELRENVPAAVRRARASEPLLNNEEYSTIGEVNAMVEVHENGVLIHFPETPTSGVILSLDTAASPQLSQFVNQCTSVFEQPGERYTADSPDTGESPSD